MVKLIDSKINILIMKKRILTLLVAIGICAAANAQLLPSFDLGLKAGMNYTSISSGVMNADARAGFLAGAWGRIGMFGVHLQPELYYTNKNSRVAENDSRVSTIDVPVLIGTKVGVGPVGGRFQAGPLFSFVTDKNRDAEARWRDNFTALAIGAGADISKLSIDLRYELGLGNFSRSPENAKLNLWTLSLGYNFL